jgi:hypothetical protein
MGVLFISLSYNEYHFTSAQWPAVLNGNFRVFSNFLPAYMNTTSLQVVIWHQVTCWTTSRFPMGAEIMFFKLSRPVVWPNHSPIQQLPGMERPVCESDQTSRSSAFTPCVFILRCLNKLKGSSTLISTPTFWQISV